MGNGQAVYPPEGSHRWVFYDVHERTVPPYVWEWYVNPNEGGSPNVQKAVSVAVNTGPNRGALLQEGRMEAPTLSFGGVILHRDQYEVMEAWFDWRILIGLMDDLDRQFLGVFAQWQPNRQRRGTNPWYHTYQAQFRVSAYKTASGVSRFARWPLDFDLTDLPTGGFQGG